MRLAARSVWREWENNKLQTSAALTLPVRSSEHPQPARPKPVLRLSPVHFIDSLAEARTAIEPHCLNNPHNPT